MNEELEEYLRYLEEQALYDGHDVSWVEAEVLEVKEMLIEGEEVPCGTR